VGWSETGTQWPFPAFYPDVNAQKARSAEVTQSTIPLEMWMETKIRRCWALWLEEMRDPTYALVADARRAMTARIRITNMR
jgi:hypothetical protein